MGISHHHSYRATLVYYDPAMKHFVKQIVVMATINTQPNENSKILQFSVLRTIFDNFCRLISISLIVILKEQLLYFMIQK